jgi:hypothetical protein
VADLLVIVPSRGRPQNIARLALAWLSTATGRSELLVAVDDDDPELPAYRTALNAYPWIRRHIGPRLRLCGTLNEVAVAEAPNHRALAFLGDDHIPRSPGFDPRLVAALDRLGTGIAYGNDLLQGEKMPTAVAMTSDIVQTLGYMAAPSMVHLCLDLVWLDWGRGIDRITYLNDVVIEHMHPANGKAVFDDRYAEVNSAEQIASDSAAYYAYRDGGHMDADLAKLRALIGSP